jgi:hypothetical protein
MARDDYLSLRTPRAVESRSSWRRFSQEATRELTEAPIPGRATITTFVAQTTTSFRDGKGLPEFIDEAFSLWPA